MKMKGVPDVREGSSGDGTIIRVDGPGHHRT